MKTVKRTFLLLLLIISQLALPAAHIYANPTYTISGHIDFTDAGVENSVLSRVATPVNFQFSNPATGLYSPYVDFNTTTNNYNVTVTPGVYTRLDMQFSTGRADATMSDTTLNLDATAGNVTQDLHLDLVTMNVHVMDMDGNPVSGIRLTENSLVPTSQYQYAAIVSSQATAHVFQANMYTFTDASGNATFYGFNGLSYNPMCAPGLLNGAPVVCQNSGTTLNSDANITLQELPPFVSNVVATPPETNQPPTITWQPGSPEVGHHPDHYNIYRDFTYFASTANTIFTDNTLTADGNHFYEVVEVNDLGLTGQLLRQYTRGASVNYDTTPPVIADLAFVSGLGPVVSKQDGAAIRFTAHVTDSLSTLSPAEYYIDVDPGAGHGTPLPLGAGYPTPITGQYNNVVNLSLGTHHVYVRGEDGAGNWGTPVSLAFTVITPAPIAPDGVYSSTPTNQKPVISWYATPEDVSYKVYRNGTYIGTTTGASFTDTALSANGTYDYTVSGVGQDNSESDQSYPTTVVYDTLPPTVANLAINPHVITPTSTISITADAADVLSGVAGGEYYIDTDPGQGNATPLTYNAGALSVTTNLNLGNGKHTLYVRARDEAGNWTATPASIKFVFH